jgi:hypothetical protein
MKIAKYVGDLLYNYECVVIPGLGGFLTNDKPASINSASNLFKPPFKQIFFNAFLKTNDGLLVNYVAREEGLEYREAKEQVDRFVLMCDSALKEGKRINFHRIGYLYLNEKQQISFEQDNSVNYNADAFGLTSFISPAVYKQTPEEKLREKVTAAPQPKNDNIPPSLHENNKKERELAEKQKPTRVKTHLVASKRRSPYRTQMTVLVVMVLAMVVGWGFMNKTTVKKYYSNYSSVIPLFYSSPNTYLVDNMNHAPMSKIGQSKTGLWIVSLFRKMEHSSENKPVAKMKNKAAHSVAKSKSTAPILAKSNAKNDSKIVEKATKTPAKSLSLTAKTVSNNNTVANNATKKSLTIFKKENKSGFSSSQGHIFIIAGAFRDKSNAENLIHKLRLKGYPAVEAGFTKSGLLRVAFGQFESKEKAEQQLLAIRNDENPSAWIFEN